MPAFDMGLVNGDNFGATQVDAIENAITDRGTEVVTTAQRLAITGARLFDGKVVFDTNLRELLWYDLAAAKWRGTRSHRFAVGGSAVGPFTDNVLHTALSTTLPDYSVDGEWQVWAQLYLAAGAFVTNYGDVYVGLYLGGVEKTEDRIDSQVLSANNQFTVTLIGSLAQAAGSTTSVTVEWQQLAPGDRGISTVSDPRFNQVQAIFTPT